MWKCNVIKYKDFEYTNVNNDLIEYNCLYCHKNYPKKFDEILKKRGVNNMRFL